MRRIFVILGMLLVIGSATAISQQPQTIDRIIATVNKQPLLLSDWYSSMRIQAFLNGRDVNSYTEKDRKAELSRLIDRELLLQQMQADYSPSPKEISEKVRSLRAQLKGAENEEGWRQQLAAYGIGQGDVEESIRMQLQILRFIDLRLRPTVRVDEEAIENYYREAFLPAMKKSGSQPQPLQQVRFKIRELLVQQKMDGVLETWLTNLRSQSEVHIASDAEALSSRTIPGGGVESKDKIVVPK